MTIRELEKIVNEVSSIKGLKKIITGVIDDFNEENARVIFEVEDPLEDLRGISGKLRYILRKRGFSKKDGTISLWIPPQKRTDPLGYTEAITRSFVIDLDYWRVNYTPDESLLEEWVVFEKNNHSGLNNSVLEEIFLETYQNVDNVEDHISAIERSIGDGYDVHILYKYEHSGISFELHSSSNWDSCVTGCIAIKKESNITPDEVINILNRKLEENNYVLEEF